MKIKELLKSPDNWCRKYSATDKNGKEISVYDSEAVKFCISGAIDHCYDDDLKERLVIRRKIASYLYEKQLTVVRFNDDPNTTHSMVLELLEKLDV